MGRRWRDGSGRLIVPRGEDGEALRDEDGEKPTAAPMTLPLEIAASYRARTKGLLGRDAVAGAMLLTPASSVHTFGMRIPIDVAYLDRRLTVLAVRTMPPGRLGLPRLRARHVLEAEAGAMAGWGVRAGVRVSVEPA
ncbi:DUF192 domain-containing protein [Streptomyces sp. NPDC054783]